MRTTTTIDKAGRLVLPKAIRQALCVGPGDTIEIESDANRAVLSPVRVRPGLQKERGIWVYRSGTPMKTSISDLIDQQRERRTRELIGGKE
jgi:AbrB family looped-hinge helix DNA binding protein